ncbi:MAG: STM4012 family radical SAM protein [Fimbriiglobus sp.]
MITLDTVTDEPFQQYVYAYPHKSAYRAFEPARRLAEVWKQEPRTSLFLYVHIPFCTMRCGFCNLFTTANPQDSWPELYLDALTREADVLAELLPDATFARIALGGGTPTYLTAPQLDRVFTLLKSRFGASPRALPTGVEVSPDTVTREKADLLRSWGVERVSIGIQSFLEDEARNSGRPQTPTEIHTALGLLRDVQTPILNIDLIYGLPGQSTQTWAESLKAALEYQPEELYLYPLYVRPLTGLGQANKTYDADRLTLFRQARETLLASGYEQVSLRMFRRIASSATIGPAYCVQEDGMVGLGCGARSYTRDTHYSRDYAVRPKPVKAILQDYITADREDFSFAHHGFELNLDEQKRRYLLYSLFTRPGTSLTAYQARFGTTPTSDYPELTTWLERGWLTLSEDLIRPTDAGLELSDALGPRLFSDAVRSRMAEYDHR